MSKSIKRVIQGILFIGIIMAFIYIGNMDFSAKVTVDNERFDQDYPLVNADNVFSYVNASETYSSLKNGNAIIFMGYPANTWTGYYASILNEAAKENEIKEILYYDFYDDRDLKNAVYQSIVLRLSEFLPNIDNKQNIYAPTLIVIKAGEIIYFDDETSIQKGTITPENYWNSFSKDVKKRELSTAFREYLGGYNE